MLHDGFDYHSLNAYYFWTSLMTHENYCHYLFSSQTNISEEREQIISIKSTRHRARKDISEVIEQLPSSKDISEAHRVF